MDDYLHQELQLTIKSNWQVFPVEDRGVDFIGFRKFHDFSLLRKRTCKKFKKKMLVIRSKQEKHQLINYAEWCSANSYKGWLQMCDSCRLSEKYLIPIQPSLDRYYKEIVKGRKSA